MLATRIFQREAVSALREKVKVLILMGKKENNCMLRLLRSMVIMNILSLTVPNL